MKKLMVGMLAVLSIGLGAWQFPPLEILEFGTRTFDCEKLLKERERLDSLIEVNKRLVSKGLADADKAVQVFSRQRDEVDFYFYWSSCREI